MAFSGFCALVLPGESCQNITDLGKLTVSGRFYRWRQKGSWQNILQRLQQQAETAGKINWDIHFVDGSVIRAHQHAAGAIRGELDAESELSAIEQVQERESLGWSKGGFSTKIQLRCDGNGRPINFLLSVGERHEAVLFEPLICKVQSKAQDQEDRGYDHDESVVTRVTVVGKLGVICAEEVFAIRFHGKSMSIEEESLTKLFTVCETRLSDV